MGHITPRDDGLLDSPRQFSQVSVGCYIVFAGPFGGFDARNERRNWVEVNAKSRTTYSGSLDDRCAASTERIDYRAWNASDELQYLLGYFRYETRRVWVYVM